MDDFREAAEQEAWEDEREELLRELVEAGEEPPHAATKDPRPDPRTHPEAWTE
jgi:hypothetical protein